MTACALQYSVHTLYSLYNGSALPFFSLLI